MAHRALLGLSFVLACSTACGPGADGSLALTATGTVSGTIYLDRDGDGVISPGVDRPLAGVRVDLLSRGGQGIASAVSSAAGAYVLRLVPVGTYRVAPDTAVLSDSLNVARSTPGDIVLGAGDTVFVEVGVGRRPVSIASARAAALRRPIAIEAVVENGWGAFGDSTLHIRDATGSIRATGVRPMALLTGDSVRVFGARGVRGGQPALLDAELFIIGRGSMLPSRRLTTGDASRALDGRLDAALVDVLGASVVDARVTSGGRVQVVVDDGSGALTVVLEPSAAVNPEIPVVPGVTIDVVGLLSAGVGGWQLRPRGNADVAVSAATFPVAQLRSLPSGRLVTLDAVALTGWNTFSDGTLHLADPSGAILAVRVPGGFLFAGDSVRLIGTVGASNGQPVLSALPSLTVRRLGKGRLPAPVEVSAARAAGAADGRLDAALVRLANLSIRDTMTVGDGLFIEAVDTSGNVGILIDTDLGMAFTRFVPGAVLEVQGVLAPAAGGRRWILKPRAKEEIAVR